MTDNRTPKQRLSEALYAIYEMHNKKIGEVTVRIWWQLCEQRGIDNVLQALTTHTMSPAGKFLPKPADIIELLDGCSDERATAAWYEFASNLKRYGTNRSVTFADPLINQVVHSMGGWIMFGGMDEKDLSFKQKSFEALYRQYLNNPPEMPPGHLIGKEEDVNVRMGYEPDHPVLIGDKTKALENYKKGLEFKGQVARLADLTKGSAA